MIEHCKHMCATQENPESPERLLAWKQELSLTEDQVTNLRTVEEKAISDAKALLSAEQVDKLKKLARDTKPESMMQCMMHGQDGKRYVYALPVDAREGGALAAVHETIGPAIAALSLPD